MRREHEERERRWQESHSPDKMLKYYAEYDDDKEAERGDDYWFTDRDRWVDMRRKQREYERQADEADRRKENPQPPPVQSLKRPVSAEPVRGQDFMASLSRMVKRDLPFLSPLYRGGNEKLFNYRIDWSSLSRAIIDKKILPLIESRIVQYLGEKDQDLFDFIVEAVIPQTDSDTKDAMSVLEEILTAFGDNEEERNHATSLIEDIWRVIIWETEKAKLAADREISGLEVPLLELDIGHVQL